MWVPFMESDLSEVFWAVEYHNFQIAPKRSYKQQTLPPTEAKGELENGPELLKLPQLIHAIFF